MSDNEGVDAIFRKAAEDHERFVSEMKELDAAWSTGKLHEWVDKKIESVKKGTDATSTDSGGNTTGTT